MSESGCRLTNDLSSTIWAKDWCVAVSELCCEVVKGAVSSMASTTAIQKQMLNGFGATKCTEYVSAYPEAVAVSLVQHMYIAAKNLSSITGGDIETSKRRLAEACVTMLTHSYESVESAGTNCSNLSGSLRAYGVKEAFRLLCAEMDPQHSPFSRQEAECSQGEVLTLFLTKAGARFDELIRPMELVSTIPHNCSHTGDVPAPPREMVPAAFISLVSAWSGEERDRLCAFHGHLRGQSKLTLKMLSDVSADSGAYAMSLAAIPFTQCMSGRVTRAQCLVFR